jgi:hypothetical protein
MILGICSGCHGALQNGLLHFCHTNHPWFSAKIAPAFMPYQPSMVIKKAPMGAFLDSIALEHYFF